MNKYAFCLIAGIGMLVSSNVLAGNEVMVTGATAKSGATALSFDVVSDGNAVAFQFAVDLPGVAEKGIDTSACTSGLPKGWTAFCAVKGTQVRIAAMGGLDSPLPAGVINVGRVGVSGLKGTAVVSEVEFADRSANVISTKGSVDLQ